MKRNRAPNESPWEEQLERALACDDRPIVGVVALDPSGETGECGLAVWGRTGWEAGEPARWWCGNPLSAGAFRWLGDEVAALCPQATRVLFVAEADAFGPSVARKLGIGIGALQGLLLDLNAIPARSRIDVASVTWRNGTGIKAGGRQGLKARAIELAKPYVGGSTLPEHAAEAVHLARFMLGELQRRSVP